MIFLTSSNEKSKVLCGLTPLLLAAILVSFAGPAMALKYAAAEHEIDADPGIPTWKPNALRIEPKQELNIIGSNTMDEITLEWVKLFRKAYPKLSVTMEARASGTGASGLIEEKSHIATVARELLPLESEAFIAKFGYEATGFRVATGSLGSLGKTAATVIFVDNNNPIKGLTMPELDAIYSVSRNRGHKEIVTWGDVGLKGEWEKRPIKLYGLEPPNGIEQYFKSTVLLDGEYKGNIEFVKSGKEHAFNVAAEKMAREPGGLTYAMLANLTPDVRVVPLAEGKGEDFITPTVESNYDHTYPMSRYIYIYVNKDPDKNIEPEVKEFLKAVLSYQGQSAIAREGVFMPLQAEVVQEELKRLESM